MQQESCQSEQCVSDYVQEAKRLASFQDTSNSISDCSYRPYVVSDFKLGLVGISYILSKEWCGKSKGSLASFKGLSWPLSNSQLWTQG